MTTYVTRRHVQVIIIQKKAIVLSLQEVSSKDSCEGQETEADGPAPRALVLTPIGPNGTGLQLTLAAHGGLLKD